MFDYCSSNSDIESSLSSPFIDIGRGFDIENELNGPKVSECKAKMTQVDSQIEEKPNK